MLPTTPCVNCTPIDSTDQYWCVMRPPNTDCSVLPFNNNFKRVRTLYWYQCRVGQNNVIAICCSAWREAGCCNSSEQEPPCSGGGATYRCSEFVCP